MTHSAFCSAQGRVVGLNPKDGGKLRSLAWICMAVAGLLLVAPLFMGSTLVGFLILLVKNVKTDCPESN